MPPHVTGDPSSLPPRTAGPRLALLAGVGRRRPGYCCSSSDCGVGWHFCPQSAQQHPHPPGGPGGRCSKGGLCAVHRRGSDHQRILPHGRCHHDLSASQPHRPPHRPQLADKGRAAPCQCSRCLQKCLRGVLYWSACRRCWHPTGPCAGKPSQAPPPRVEHQAKPVLGAQPQRVFARQLKSFFK